MSYHERVARKMKASYSAGSLNSYETILEALHRCFPTEQALREHIEQMEHEARTHPTHPAPPGWTYLDDH